MSFEFVDNIPERRLENNLRFEGLMLYETFIFQSSRGKEVYMKIPQSGCMEHENCYLHMKGHGARYSTSANSYVLRVKVFYNFVVA